MQVMRPIKLLVCPQWQATALFGPQTGTDLHPCNLQSLQTSPPECALVQLQQRALPQAERIIEW